jgi:hypothetical protein
VSVLSLLNVNLAHELAENKATGMSQHREAIYFV